MKNQKKMSLPQNSFKIQSVSENHGNRGKINTPSTDIYMTAHSPGIAFDIDSMLILISISLACEGTAVGDT
jgi:hypothetical protein